MERRRKSLHCSITRYKKSPTSSENGTSEVTFNVGSDDSTAVVDIVACATASAANFVAAGEGVAVVVAITANIIFVFDVTFNAVVTAAAVEGIAAVVSLFKFNQLMQDSAASRDLCFFHT